MAVRKCLVEKIEDLMEKAVLRIMGEYSRINDKYMQLYLNEVRQDINLLREVMHQCKFERDNDFVFQDLVKKYQEKYCPSALYRFFSFDNQLEYVYLRAEIDEILSKKDEFFSDFLGNV